LNPAFDGRLTASRRTKAGALIGSNPSEEVIADPRRAYLLATVALAQRWFGVDERVGRTPSPFQRRPV
jgi:hypothetical protein